VRVDQKEQVPTFFLTSTATAIVDAIVVTSTSLQLRVEVLSFVICSEFALGIAAFAYGSHAAAVSGVVVGVLGALWSVGSFLYLAAQRKAAQHRMRDRIQDLSYLAGRLGGLSATGDQWTSDDEVKTADRWRIIQVYLETLQGLGATDRPPRRR
jgi:hypothetical protein